MPGRRALVLWFVGLLAVAYLGYRIFALLYVHFEWFRSLHLTTIFWRTLSGRVETGLAGGLLFGLFLYGNLWLAAPSLSTPAADAVRAALGTRPRRPPVRWLGFGAVAVAVLAGWILSTQWGAVWFAKDAVPFGVRDPIYGRDVADYVFRLPLYELAYQTTGIAFWVSGLSVLGLYFTTGWFNFLDGRFLAHPRARAHLFGLLSGYLALKAVGYRLDLWNLMYTTHGFVPGVSYVDVHVHIPLLHVLIVLAALAAAAAAAAAAGWARLVWWCLGGLVVCSVGVGTIVPAVVEAVVVRPSQLQRERPYIENDILATRAAFALQHIQVEPFPVNQSLTASSLASFQPTFENIRLWDWQIAGPALQQLQGLRTYYTFDPASIDRMTVQGQYSQVLVSAREINYGQLPAATWQNVHMKYTHGYGVVVLPSAQVGAQGMPNFWVRDIRGTSSVGIQITQPRIYYGLQTTPYAIVGPQISEFDYPQGQTDVYNHYAGTGGISLGSAFQRLAFAVWAGNFNVLFAQGIGPGSRALIYRDVPSRVSHLLGEPFLTWDSNPYITIVGGHLYWIIDGYTTSSLYPYSAPDAFGVNYIRNSVKAVIDAYNGTVTFYVADPTDPIIRTEERIFPGVFQPLSSMPAALRAQIRYPQDYFSAQAHMFEMYHMTDPPVFYNQEDRWSVAKETVSTLNNGVVNAKVPPYYVILQFPGMAQPQFVLMEPFTPYSTGGPSATTTPHDNMVAWMAAFSDGAQYGKAVAYEFPKDLTVFGPLQIESQINQDSTVAEILALWSQGGSQVARGNLLVIPIQHSLLYVEPLYQVAAQTQLPALRRVIVDFGGQQIAIGTTLDQALAQIFGPLPWNQAAGTAPPPSVTPATGGGTASSSPLPGLAAQAQGQYAAAQAGLKKGDLVTFAERIAALGATLARMGGPGAAALSGGSSGAASGTASSSAASGTAAGPGSLTLPGGVG